MLCSPRRPSSTMRIFSSAEYCSANVLHDPFGGQFGVCGFHPAKSVSQVLTPHNALRRRLAISIVARGARIINQYISSSTFS